MGIFNEFHLTDFLYVTGYNFRSRGDFLAVAICSLVGKFKSGQPYEPVRLKHITELHVAISAHTQLAAVDVGVGQEDVGQGVELGGLVVLKDVHWRAVVKLRKRSAGRLT
jgi:hypothetical protein